MDGDRLEGNKWVIYFRCYELIFYMVNVKLGQLLEIFASTQNVTGGSTDVKERKEDNRHMLHLIS